MDLRETIKKIKGKYSNIPMDYRGRVDFVVVANNLIEDIERETADYPPGHDIPDIREFQSYKDFKRRFYVDAGIDNEE